MWPTPSAQEPGWKNIEVVDKDGNPPKHHNQRFYDKKTGRVVQKGLQQVISMWPTPRAEKVTDEKEETWRKRQRKGDVSTPPLSLAVKMWPTPKARDGKGGYQGGRIRNGKISRDTLDVTVQYTDNQEKTGGQLNPKWVAWLMGYPTEYLSCVPWETRSSRKSRKK
jgi:hypothetical protein